MNLRAWKVFSFTHKTCFYRRERKNTCQRTIAVFWRDFVYIARCRYKAFKGIRIYRIIAALFIKNDNRPFTFIKIRIIDNLMLIKLKINQPVMLLEGDHCDFKTFQICMYLWYIVQFSFIIKVFAILFSVIKICCCLDLSRILLLIYTCIAYLPNE